MMQFRYPWMFFLALPVAWLLWQHFRLGTGRKRLLFPFAQIPALKLRPLAGWSRKLLAVIRLAAFALLLAALARPQTSSSSTRRLAEGIDIMIAFDVSKSMTIEDYDPHSRLEIAKKVVRDFVDGRKDDRIGFLMFSGESVTLCPPTLDYEVLDQAIESASVNELKDGTAIGDALASSVNRLKESTAKSRVIILITDGDSNAGSIAPLTAGEMAAGYGIKVYTIALGREGRVPLPVYEDFFGQTRKRYEYVFSSINPQLLQQIAQETGGKFYRPTGSSNLSEVFKEIDRLERTRVETKQKVRWDEKFPLFLFPALLLLWAEFILGRVVFRPLPN